jgi:hypothetical protein
MVSPTRPPTRVVRGHQGRVEPLPRSQAFGSMVFNTDDALSNIAESIYLKRSGEGVCFAFKKTRVQAGGNMLTLIKRG